MSLSPLRRVSLPAVLLLLALSACGALASPRSSAVLVRGDLLAATLRTLDSQIPDLPVSEAVRHEFLARARAAQSFAEERAITRELIDRIPASHIALFSTYAKEYFELELAGRDAPTIGFQLSESGGELLVSKVLRGTPAEETGIRRGDRLIAIDGIPAMQSRRLDPRHDDAAPPDEATHLLRVGRRDQVRVSLERNGAGPATEIEVVLPATVTSSLRSDRAGARMVELDGVKVGVLPLSYIYSKETSRLFLDSLAGPLIEANCLVLDLRGRGGSGISLMVLTSMLRNPTIVGDLPIVAAIDRRTRSAKEVLARDIRALGIGTLVGERTAGAVRPARWLPLPRETWLLCPSGSISDDPRGLEGSGVAPDIAAKDPFPGGDGADPILEAAIAEAARQVAARRSAARERRRD